MDEDIIKVIASKWQSQDLKCLSYFRKISFCSQGTCNIVKERLNFREKGKYSTMNIKISNMHPRPWPCLLFVSSPLTPKSVYVGITVPSICEWLQTWACVHWKLWGVREAAHKWCSYSFKIFGLISSLSRYENISCSEYSLVQKCNVFFVIWGELVEATNILIMGSLECCYCLWRSGKCEFYLYWLYSCFYSSKSKIAIKNTNLVKWQNVKWSESTSEKMKPVLSSQPYMCDVEILCKTPVSAFQHDKGCWCAFITLLTVYCGIIFSLCHCATKDGLITLI